MPDLPEVALRAGAANLAGLRAFIAGLDTPQQKRAARAIAHDVAVEAEWPANGQRSVTRGNQRLEYQRRPEIIRGEDGQAIGIDALTRYYVDGLEVAIDPHTRIINPPTQHADQVDPLSALDEVVFQRIAEKPAPERFGTEGTVTVVFSTTNDGRVNSNNATYATARSGSGLSAASAESASAFGQDKDTFIAGQYFCMQVFLEFDINAGIGLGGFTAIETCQLALAGFSDGSTTDFTMDAYEKSFGAAVDTTDFVAGASISALPRMATLSTAGFAVGSYNTFTSDAAFRFPPRTSGSFLQLMLVSARQAAGTTPTGAEYVYVYMADQAGTTLDPKITIVTVSSGVGLKDQATNSGTGTNPTISVGVSAEFKSGRRAIIAIGCGWQTGQTITPPAGFTLLGQSTLNGVAAQYIYDRICTDADISATWNFTVAGSTNIGWHIAAAVYEGSHGTPQIDTYAGPSTTVGGTTDAFETLTLRRAIVQMVQVEEAKGASLPTLDNDRDDRGSGLNFTSVSDGGNRITTLYHEALYETGLSSPAGTWTSSVTLTFGSTFGIALFDSPLVPPDEDEVDVYIPAEKAEGAYAALAAAESDVQPVSGPVTVTPQVDDQDQEIDFLVQPERSADTAIAMAQGNELVTPSGGPMPVNEGLDDPAVQAAAEQIQPETSAAAAIAMAADTEYFTESGLPPPEPSPDGFADSSEESGADRIAFDVHAAATAIAMAAEDHVVTESGPAPPPPDGLEDTSELNGAEMILRDTSVLTAWIAIQDGEWWTPSGPLTGVLPHVGPYGGSATRPILGTGSAVRPRLQPGSATRPRIQPGAARIPRPGEPTE